MIELVGVEAVDTKEREPQKIEAPREQRAGEKQR
jgi:hypothetical protein